MWYLVEENGHTKLMSGSSALTVSKIERHTMENMIKVYEENDEEPHVFDLQNFDSTKNLFCERLKSVTSSRSLFVKAFNHLRGDSTDSGTTYEPSDADVSVQSKKKAASKTSDNNVDKQKKRTQKKKSDNAKYQSNLKVLESYEPRHEKTNNVVVRPAHTQISLGECIDVHVSNLVEPSPERLVRLVNGDHVKFLTEEFRKNSTSFVIMAGLVSDEVDIERLAEPNCGVDVEVIGGNHTRIALQFLLASGELPDETVKVKLYCGLTNDEALEVGVFHNDQAQKSKKMSFMDVARLIKEKLQNCQPEDLLTEKKKLAKIFGQKNVTSFNNNYKAALSLAKRANTNIWRLALSLEKKWRDGEIKGGRKGEEMKQTVIHDLYSKNLNDEDRELLLETIIEKGRPAFTKLLQQLAEKNNKADNAEYSGEAGTMEPSSDTTEATNITEDMAEVTSHQNEQVDGELDLEHEIEEITAGAQTNDNPEDERNQLIMEISQLRQENENLKKENEKLKEMVKDLKENRMQEACDKNAFAGRLNLVDKRVLEEADNNENQEPPPKRKPVIMDDGFSVGEAVKAIWSKDGNMYDARIMKKHANGTYTVKFYDGIKETRTRKQIKPRF